MKQTLTRDGFLHALKRKSRDDIDAHNIMILGNAIFDLHDALAGLLERTEDLYHPTIVGKPGIKMSSAKDVGTLDTTKPVKPLKMTVTDKEEGIEPL